MLSQNKLCRQNAQKYKVRQLQKNFGNYDVKSFSRVLQFPLCSIFFCIFVVLCQSSCSIVSFENEGVKCSINSEQCEFYGSSIEFYFSSQPDKYQAERSISLLADNKAEELIFSWNKTVLSITPAIGWSKGRNYKLSFNGQITINTSSISVNIVRSFLYGKGAEQLLFLRNESNLFPQNSNEPLILKFSKPIEKTSYLTNFSISPNAENEITFSQDNTEVLIKPKDQWEYNTLYSWSFENIQSNDNYFCKTSESGNFSPFSDSTIPEITNIFPIKQFQGKAEYLKEMQIDKNLSEEDGIGFSFSKPMDFDSIKNGISFEPAISGYVKKLDEDGKEFAFFPTETYKVNEKYSICLSNSIKDIHAIQLFEEKRFFFTSSLNFLQIEKIDVNGEVMNLADLQSQKCPAIKNLESKYELTVNICFSTVIKPENQNLAVKKINMSLLFPATSESPVQTQIQWNNSGNRVSLTWENFSIETADVESFYKLQIIGGKNGINNGFGEYMEDDLCIMLKPVI